MLESRSRKASKPVDLPSPDVLLERAIDLEALLAADPVRGREELKRLFENGRLLVEPQPEGHCIARGRLFPLALLSLDLTAETYRPWSFSAPGPVKTPDTNLFKLWSSDGCAGLQLDLPDPQIAEKFAYWVPLDEAIAVGWE